MKRGLERILGRDWRGKEKTEGDAIIIQLNCIKFLNGKFTAKTYVL